MLASIDSTASRERSFAVMRVASGISARVAQRAEAGAGEGVEDAEADAGPPFPSFAEPSVSLSCLGVSPAPGAIERLLRHEQHLVRNATVLKRIIALLFGLIHLLRIVLLALTLRRSILPRNPPSASSPPASPPPSFSAPLLPLRAAARFLARCALLPRSPRVPVALAT